MNHYKKIASLGSIRESNDLSPSLKEKGQRLYLWFTRLNALSYASLADSILILYAIKLGASDSYVAVITSFLYFTMPFMLLGKSLIGKLGTAKSYSLNWALRNLSASLMILVPVIQRHYSVNSGLYLLSISAFLFFTFRSIGMVSGAPLIGEISSPQDRGSFISKIWLSFTSFSLVLMVIIATILNRYKSVQTFQGIILFGVITGLSSSYLIYHVPESPRTRFSGQEKLSSAYRFITRNLTARRLLIMWTAITMSIMLVIPIGVVALKRGYQLSDHVVLIFIIVQLVGSIYASYNNKLFLDHVGSRPLIILYSIGLLLVQLMWVFSPAHPVWIYLGALFFILGMTNSGAQTSLSHYFLSTVPATRRVGASMFINITSGLAAGLAGSVLAGGVLKLLHSFIFREIIVYKTYFGMVAIIQLVVIGLSFRLIPQKERRITDIMGMFFSFRDWRAIYTLQKLSKPTQEMEDISILNRLQGIGSNLTEDTLVQYLESPRFAIRGRALQALNQIDFSPEVAKRIIRELENGEYTTAYLAAEILGEHGIREAIPELRKALLSKDIFLRGKAMLALTQLEDTESYRKILRIFEHSKNPRILIYGARAITYMKLPEYLNVLLKKIRNTAMPEPILNELLYSACEISHLGDEFYYFYNLHQRSSEAGPLALLDFIQSELKDFPNYSLELSTIVEQLKNNETDITNFQEFSEKCKQLHDPVLGAVRDFLNHYPDNKINEKIVLSIVLIFTRALKKALSKSRQLTEKRIPALGA